MPGLVIISIAACRRVRPKMTPLIFLKIMGLAVLE
jgi:hypothetical protein